jgi:hypothetical protein
LVKKIAVRIVERAGEDVSSSHTWEDLTIDGRLYFVTTDGNVWGLATPITNQLNLTTGLQEGGFSRWAVVEARWADQRRDRRRAVRDDQRRAPLQDHADRGEPAVTRRALAAAVLVPAVSLADLTPARADDDHCSRQSRRVRLPNGFAEARVSFVGVLTNGRNRAGASFPGSDLRELRLVVEWTEVEISSPDGALYQRFAGTLVGTGRPMTITTRLPVTASAITDSELYGEWCAEVFLDDDAAPIARCRFVLTPH